MATRFWSRIVRRGPVLVRAPRPGDAADGAATRSLLDVANLERSAELRGNGLHKFGWNDHHHADPAIERTRHLLGRDSAAFLQHLEDRRLFPAAGSDHGMAMFG